MAEDFEDGGDSDYYLPRTPAQVVARLFRTYESFENALKLYASEGIEADLPDLPRAVRRKGGWGRAERERGVQIVLDALAGSAPSQYEDALLAFCQLIKQQQLATEIKAIILPLGQAYSDPAHFFQEVAPILDPPAFDPARIGSTVSEERSDLPRTLHTWGFGALLNPVVRDAFLRVGPKLQNAAIDAAQRRKAVREGRPATRAHQIDLALQWAHGNVSEAAEAVKTSPSAIDKLLKRRATRRRRQGR